jgi:dihydropteroate synthase
MVERFRWEQRQMWVMGILNVTPDSFSDGGRFVEVDSAVAQARQMIATGADLIDVGGESTRPGAEPVSEAEEIRRVVPVIERLAGLVVSVDTTKAAVAEAALRAGARVVNDISALRWDEQMAAVAASHGAGVVLMHMQGTPQTMQAQPRYDDVVREVREFLAERIEFAVAHGIGREQIAIDPGIGFGKTVEHNLELLNRLEELRMLGCPVLVGASRKSFIGRITGREPGGRLAGSLAVAGWAAARGARILRVHDVAETRDVVRLIEAIRSHGKTI